MLNTYQIFGLNFQSPIALPNIEPCRVQVDKIDVIIKFEAIQSSFATIKQEEPFEGMVYTVGYNNRGEICTSIDFKDFARYWIENKSTIIVERKPNGSDEDIFSYLMSLAIVSLLFQREELVIHAGAISINNQAVMVLGDSGAGKTTTTAKFAHLGFDMLAEDVSVVRFIDDIPHVVSGIPYLKLLPETAKIVEQNWDTLTSLYSDMSKKAWTIPNYKHLAVPLKKIFWLQTTEGETIETKEVELEDAFYALAANIHYPILYSCYDIDDIATNQAVEIVNQTSSTILKRPIGKNTVHEIIELIKNEMELVDV